MSFGYEVLVSPLQTLMLYNAVANNGKMMQPYLVQEVSIAWRKDDDNPALASFLAVARELAGDAAFKPANAGG